MVRLAEKPAPGKSPTLLELLPSVEIICDTGPEVGGHGSYEFLGRRKLLIMQGRNPISDGSKHFPSAVPDASAPQVVGLFDLP
jgi:hypothetical protein